MVIHEAENILPVSDQLAYGYIPSAVTHVQR